MANCVTCRALCRWAGQHYVANCIGYVPNNYQKPITKADSIRAMSDEQLAEWFHNNTTICPPGLKMKECTKGVKYCLNCWLDWLRQEAEEEE